MPIGREEEIRAEIKRATWLKQNEWDAEDYTFYSAVPILVKTLESTEKKEMMFDNYYLILYEKGRRVYRRTIRDITRCFDDKLTH